MHRVWLGAARIWILIALLLVLACIAGTMFYGQITQLMASRPVSAASSPPVQYDLSAPPVARSGALYLLASGERYEYCYKGLIARELFRQALLIAARDEMSLQTRDSSLREWTADPPPQSALQMDFMSDRIRLHDARKLENLRWQSQPYDNNSWSTDLASVSEKLESMSRADYVKVLQKSGWSGKGHSFKQSAPPPPDAEARLRQMEELSQFGIIRETHDLIRTDGESPERLGVLVRGYANLAQLARYHWSLEFAVYTARSLLYAQRLVQLQPNSGNALWHRAYAYALAGLQGKAMDDLKAAAKFPHGNPPAWVSLLEPFCKYQTGALVNLATGNPNISGLGMYLAFVSVENSGSQGAVMNIATAALAMNPRCLRIIETMCDNTGPGMLNELSETGPSTFSQTLGSELQKVPSFPKKLRDQIDGFRRPNGNPNGRETICEELISAGSPEADLSEPSWAALGRLIQETTFAHVARKANLIANQWGVDASDYVQESQPFIDGHPFKFVIDTYGLLRQQNVDQNLLKHTASETVQASFASTLRQFPVYTLDSMILPDGPQSADNYFGWIITNSDDTSFDIEKMYYIYRYDESPMRRGGCLDHLRTISPESPITAVDDMQTHWDPGRLPQWEIQSDSPIVAEALGRKFTSLGRWADAEKYLRKYIAVAPDQVGYEDLAKMYRAQGKEDKWLATLNEYLTRGEDYGLQDAQVQVEIAQHFMDRKDYKSAQPYADAAYQTAAGWAIICAANVHTYLGDFSTAEQYLIEEINHYSTSPIEWYRWCLDTGHGQTASARNQLLSYFQARETRLSGEELQQMGCAQIDAKDYQDAIKTFKRRETAFPGPASELHIALLEDALHNATARDDALVLLKVLPESTNPVAKLGALFQEAVQKSQDAAPDPAAVEALTKGASESQCNAIYSLAGFWLQNRGRTREATEYFKKCLVEKQWYDDGLWAESLMRANGVEPWTLYQSTGTWKPIYGSCQ